MERIKKLKEDVISTLKIKENHEDIINNIKITISRCLCRRSNVKDG